MKKFKIRCSAIGKIMSNSKNAITEKQLSTIIELENKPKRTDKQEETLQGLIKKRDNPELSETTKGYCKDWLKSSIYDSKTVIKSKFLDKGNIVEDESIDFIAKVLGYGFLIKNEQGYSDEYMQGTPDVSLNDIVIDAKNSWDCFTFPLFDSKIPNTDYYWQLQGYMNLTGSKKAKLIYCLLDTPEHLIQRSAYWYCMENGYEEMDPDIYKEYHKNLTYKGVDDRLKIKVFDIDRNDDDIQKIKDRVVECREYINSLISEFNLPV